MSPNRSRMTPPLARTTERSSRWPTRAPYAELQYSDLDAGSGVHSWGLPGVQLGVECSPGDLQTAESGCARVRGSPRPVDCVLRRARAERQHNHSDSSSGG